MNRSDSQAGLRARVEELLRRGLYAEATEIARAAVLADPRDRTARMVLADAFEAEGALDDAREVLGELLEWTPYDLDVIERLRKLQPRRRTASAAHLAQRASWWISGIERKLVELELDANLTPETLELRSRELADLAEAGCEEILGERPRSIRLGLRALRDLLESQSPEPESVEEAARAVAQAAIRALESVPHGPEPSPSGPVAAQASLGGARRFKS